MFQKIRSLGNTTLIMLGVIIASVLFIIFIVYKIFSGTKDIKPVETATLPTPSPTITYTDTTTNSNGSGFNINGTEKGTTPTPTPKATSTPTPTPTSSSVPSNNDSPSVDLITDGIENETLQSSQSVYLQANVSDSVGGVATVDFYLNGSDKATVEPRNIYASTASGWSSSDADKATTKAVNYLTSKYSESNLTYAYRKYNKFDTSKNDCSIKEGYILIMLGQKYLYDVRVSDDLADIEVCYKGKSLNYNNRYIYMFKGNADDYDFYVKATDTYGASTKTAKISFTLK